MISMCHCSVMGTEYAPFMNNTNFTYSDESQPLIQRAAIQLIEKATGQPKLRQLYLEYQRSPVQGESFWQASIRKLDIRPVFEAADIKNIPATGPAVIVANHPYGVLDGLVMCWLIEKVRSDFLVLTHSALLRAPEARPYLLPVDFTGTKEAFETNLQTRDRARKHLAEGGCIVVFPAGAVSTAPDKLGRKPATDWPWQPFTAQLIQRSRATVVPIFFGGQNSRLFQIASHISATLRLSLIFKEVHDRMGTDLPLVIGDPLSPSEISKISDRAALTEMLRDRTYALAARLPSDIATLTCFKRSPKTEIAARFRELVRKIDGSRARRSKFRRSA